VDWAKERMEVNRRNTTERMRVGMVASIHELLSRATPSPAPDCTKGRARCPRKEREEWRISNPTHYYKGARQGNWGEVSGRLAGDA
jgi:hypothetical protein